MDMRFRGGWSAITLAIVLGLGAPPAAQAAIDIGFLVNGGIESTNAFGSVLPPGQHVQPYYVERLNPPGVDALVEQRSQNLMDLTGATARSRASFGDLGVYTQAWVVPRIDGVYGAWVSNASARAVFFDGWTLSAPGQAIGAPATLAVSFLLDGSLTPRSDDFNNSLCVSFTTYLSTGAHERNVCPTAAGLYTLSVPARLNQTFGIAMALTGWVAAYNQWSPGTSTVDFYDSAVVTGLALQDDNGAAIGSFSLVADSAHVYLPVPEPGTAAMGLAGLLVLAGAVRRRVPAH